jgi:16S rRNA (guanine527-N7)-methyltransferase
VETPLSRADARLIAFAELIRQWAPRIGLVADSDLDRLWPRHIEDSLRAAPLLQSLPPGPVVDVGSGAGFPGIPLAVALPDRRFRLVEPRARRAAFLEEVVRTLEVEVEVVRVTAEEAAGRPDLAEAHVAALARALAPPARSIELLLPLLRHSGTAVVWHGERATLPEIAEEWAEGIAIVRREAG